MRVQVISLLSSSEAGSPPLTAAPPSPPRAPSLPPGVPDLDDYGLSTIPSCRSRNPDVLSSRAKLGTSAENSNVWLVSDHDFSPPRHGRRVLGTRHRDSPEPKRRRVDPDSLVETVSSPRNRPTPRVLGSGAASRSQCLQASYGRLDLPREPPLDVLDDPFASSSPPREANEPGRTGKLPAIADDIDPFASSSPAPAGRSRETTRKAAAWDPISSSAPLPAPTEENATRPAHSLRRIQSEVIALDDSDDDRSARSGSDDEFPDITGLASSRHRFASSIDPMPAPSKASKKRKPTGTRPTSTGPKKSSEEKTRERGEKAAAREAEKERKRLEKERAKEERARQKATAAALAEVNKIRTDKKVSTPEMIVDLPSTLDETTRLQAEALLKDLEVQFTSWPSPVDNVVRWRRKVRSRYNDELGHWEPVPERIERENYAMVILTAPQLVELALGADDNTTNLESHALRMRRSFPTDTIIYLIEGLDPWMRRNRNLRNRQFVSAVRSGLEPTSQQQADAPTPSSSSSSQPNSSNPPRRRKNKNNNPPQGYVDPEPIDAALLRLQVRHHRPALLIHHTAAPAETARWIAVFTQHISTAPYRRQRDAANDANFCIDSGQVRTGDTPRDAYLRMLQEVARVTAPIAYGVAAEYGSVAALVKGLEERGPLALEKVKRGVDRTGAVSDRAVGPAVSRRLWRIFTGRDETSTDV